MTVYNKTCSLHAYFFFKLRGKNTHVSCVVSTLVFTHESFVLWILKCLYTNKPCCVYLGDWLHTTHSSFGYFSAAHDSIMLWVLLKQINIVPLCLNKQFFYRKDWERSKVFSPASGDQKHEWETVPYITNINEDPQLSCVIKHCCYKGELYITVFIFYITFI